MAITTNNGKGTVFWKRSRYLRAASRRAASPGACSACTASTTCSIIGWEWRWGNGQLAMTGAPLTLLPLPPTHYFLFYASMTRVSSGAKKSGPPAHANRFAFTHNRNSKLTKKILAFPISGLCPACVEVLEWRKKFRKYKPLSVPKKCVRCAGKTVREAYHVICNECAKQAQSCAKCLQLIQLEEQDGEEAQGDGSAELKQYFISEYHSADEGEPAEASDDDSEGDVDLDALDLEDDEEDDEKDETSRPYSESSEEASQ